MRFSRFGLGLLLSFPVLFVAWIVVCWTHVLPLLSDQQRQALAVLRAPEAEIEPDKNAFARLWFIRYDIADDARPTLLREDEQRAASLYDEGDTLAGFQPAIPDGLQEETLSNEERTWLCARTDDDPCLAKVRGNRGHIVAVLAIHSGLLKRSLDLSGSAALYDRMPRTMESPLPHGDSAELVVSDSALRFILGDVDAAMREVCTYAATWRRLRSHTDMLVFDMIGIAHLTHSAQLYAEMLAEMPDNYQPPLPCATAFEPLRDHELDQCDEMRNEFKIAEFLFDERHDQFAYKGQRFWWPFVERIVINREHNLAMAAQTYVWTCTADHQRKTLAREPEGLLSPVHCSPFERPFNSVGCTLAEIENPQWNDYYNRVLDLDARLRAVSTAEWLRSATDGGDRSFEKRPERLRDARHSMELRNGSLRVRNLVVTKFDKEWWKIPLSPAAATQ